MQYKWLRPLLILGCGLCMALIAYGGQAGNGPGRFSLMSERSSGISIRRHLVEPWRLDYRLVSPPSVKKKFDEEQERDPELVLYLDGPDFLLGENIEVFFRVLGPRGNEIRALGLSLLGGYGANLFLENAGTYNISVRVESPLGGFSDSFDYRHP
jgi:hypothetical protein